MKVLLFVTFLVDTFFPEAGEATVRLLRRFGAEPVFPKGPVSYTHLTLPTKRIV